MNQLQYTRSKGFEPVADASRVRCRKCGKKYACNQLKRMADHHWDHRRFQRQAKRLERQVRVK